ncbi:MAG: hypothetical protein COA49_02235 [Bacteroidetes bacterium]|nr:MAG: hypothetical protein COA49_02235 [Bacteroidota bacterium]
MLGLWKRHIFVTMLKKRFGLKTLHKMKTGNYFNRGLFFLFLSSLTNFLSAQTQTVGTFTNTSEAFEGYNLLAPTASNNTYLIDNCGHLINEWLSDYRVGLSAYLLEDGSLLRTARLTSNATPPFSGGGTGGRIERFSWEGDLVWSMNWADSSHHQHHDIEMMPNGNILIIGWNSHSYEECLVLGKTPNDSEYGLWTTEIIEISPTGSEGGEIVWQWNVWDHLVQDTDSLLPNYSVISDSPRRFDINYLVSNNPNSYHPDWMHINAINYNESLDQIILSSPKFCEIFIIDHSLTTEEAATELGDVLYRYGKPRNYGRGTDEDQRLFFQHDAHWVAEGLNDAGSIILFNNGRNRPEGNFSSVDIIELPQMENGTYPIDEISAFGPSTYAWSYPEVFYPEFFGDIISGATRMPNGNTLICDGPSGHAFEVNADEEIVWDYINPITAFGATTQGNNAGNNSLFRLPRYPENYSGLYGRDLTPGDVLEIDSWDTGCSSIISEVEKNPIEISPNPFSDNFSILFPEEGVWEIFTSSGMKVINGIAHANSYSYLGNDLVNGCYILKYNSTDNNKSFTLKLLKL